MTTIRSRHIVSLLCAAALVPLMPAVGFAQLGGGRGGGGPARTGKPPTRNTPPPAQQQVKKDYTTGPGEIMITKYVAPKEGIDPENPLASGGNLTGIVDKTSLSLELDPKIVISLGDGVEVKAEQFEAVLLPGAHATVNWETVENRSTHKRYKRATSITLHVTEVEGELPKPPAKAPDKPKEKEKDGVTLRLKPVGSSVWPDREDDHRVGGIARTGNTAKQQAMVQARPLLCRAIEELSKVTDENGQPVSLFDLQPEQQLKGRVLLCKGNQAVVVSMGVLGADGQIRTVKADEGRGGGTEPVGRRKGKLTVGPGG